MICEGCTHLWDAVPSSSGGLLAADRTASRDGGCEQPVQHGDDVWKRPNARKGWAEPRAKTKRSAVVMADDDIEDGGSQNINVPQSRIERVTGTS